ncbi:MAG: hypothetical protein HZA54_05390, partial [Planctomycetes bacterium]|nr:hypothetical protein [Planctomycetota bacterium]
GRALLFAGLLLLGAGLVYGQNPGDARPAPGGGAGETQSPGEEEESAEEMASATAPALLARADFLRVVLDDRPGAERDYRRVIELAPDSPEAARARAALAELASGWRRALARVLRVLGSPPVLLLLAIGGFFTLGPRL